MKSIFLNENEAQIKYVYDAASVQWLLENAGLADGIFSKKMILEQPDKWGDVRYIFSTWQMPQMTEEEIRSCFPNLEAVFYAAGTVQAFARPFLNCGVKVFSAWAANGVPVAEYTVAQIVLANKGFFKLPRIKNRLDRMEASKVYPIYPGNYGANIGIIGAGVIGKRVIRMLKAYDLHAMVFDPFLPDETAKELGVKKVGLAELFANCQVVSNHLANNDQTKGMLDYALFSSMLPNATFLNTGRGAQVVEEDLVRILRERPDLTAILDVTEPEPPLDGHPFYELDNCILTPHIAGSFGQEVHRMAAYMLEEYRLYTAEQPCRYEVTMEMLKTMA